MKEIQTRLGVAAVFGVAALLAACVPPDLTEDPGATTPGPTVNPVKGDAAAIVRGEDLFGTCSGCHAKDGTSPSVAGIALKTSAKLPDATLYDKIANGVPNTIMSAYKDMYSEDQIWDLVSFIQSYDSAPVANNSTANNTTPNNTTPNNSTAPNTTTPVGTNPLDGDMAAIANGKTRFEANCLVCHNIDGSSGPVSPKALAMSATTLDDPTMFSKIADGVTDASPQMPSYSDTFSDTEIWELVSFIRTIPGS